MIPNRTVRECDLVQVISTYLHIKLNSALKPRFPDYHLDPQNKSCFSKKIFSNYHLDPQGYVAPIQARAVFRAGSVCGRAGVRLLHLTMMMMMRMMWGR